MKTVLWDWNGTLLDDVHTCIDAMNIILNRRKLPLLTSEIYRQIFTFPVFDYYEKLGFNFTSDPFEKLAEEYLLEYDSLVQKAALFPGAADTLSHLHSKGYSQIILSAMRQTDLLCQVKTAGISSWFQDILGLKDIYAKSKIENAIQYIGKHNLKSDDICMIGDTDHDYEVSKALGCRCILIKNGHQHLECQFTGNVEILNSIVDVSRYL